MFYSVDRLDSLANPLKRDLKMSSQNILLTNRSCGGIFSTLKSIIHETVQEFHKDKVWEN